MKALLRSLGVFFASELFSDPAAIRGKTAAFVHYIRKVLKAGPEPATELLKRLAGHYSADDYHIKIRLVVLALVLAERAKNRDPLVGWILNTLAEIEAPGKIATMKRDNLWRTIYQWAYGDRVYASEPEPKLDPLLYGVADLSWSL